MPQLFLTIFKRSIGCLCISLILANIYIPNVYADIGARSRGFDALVDLPEHVDRHVKAVKQRLPELKEDLKYKDPRLQISIQDLHTAPLHKSKCIEGVLWGVGTIFGLASGYISGTVLSSDAPTRTFLNTWTNIPGIYASQFVPAVAIAPSEIFKFKESTEDLTTRKLPITPLAQKNNWWFVREATKLIGRIGVLGLSLKAAFAAYTSFNPNNPLGVRLLFASIYGVSKYLGMSEEWETTHRELGAMAAPGPQDVENTRLTWEGKLVGIGRAALTNPAFAEKLYDALQELNQDSDKQADPTGENQRVANYSVFLLLDSLLADEEAPKFSPPPTSKWAKIGRFFWPEEAPLWWKLTRLAGMGAGLMASGSIWYGSYLAWASTIGLILPFEGLTATWASVATAYAAPAAAKVSSNIASRTFTRIKEGARSAWNWGKRKLGYKTEPEGVRHDNPLLWSRDFSMTDVSNPIARGIVDPGSVVLSYFLGLPVSLLGGHEMFNRHIPMDQQLWTLGPSTFALGEMDNPSVASYTDRMITYLNSKLPDSLRDEIGRKQTYILRYLKGLSAKIRSNSDGFIRGLRTAVETDRQKRSLPADGDASGHASGDEADDSTGISGAGSPQPLDGARATSLGSGDVVAEIAVDMSSPSDGRSSGDIPLRQLPRDARATTVSGDSTRAHPQPRPGQRHLPDARLRRQESAEDDAFAAEMEAQFTGARTAQRRPTTVTEDSLTQPFLPKQPSPPKSGLLAKLLSPFRSKSPPAASLPQ